MLVANNIKKDGPEAPAGDGVRSSAASSATLGGAGRPRGVGRPLGSCSGWRPAQVRQATQIRHAQRGALEGTGKLVPASRILSLVHATADEVAAESNIEGLRFSSEALSILHLMIETVFVSVFEQAALYAAQAKRTTVMASDLQLSIAVHRLDGCGSDSNGGSGSGSGSGGSGSAGGQGSSGSGGSGNAGEHNEEEKEQEEEEEKEREEGADDKSESTGHSIEGLCVGSPEGSSTSSSSGGTGAGTGMRAEAVRAAANIPQALEPPGAAASAGVGTGTGTGAEAVNTQALELAGAAASAGGGMGAGTGMEAETARAAVNSPQAPMPPGAAASAGGSTGEGAEVARRAKRARKRSLSDDFPRDEALLPE